MTLFPPKDWWLKNSPGQNWSSNHPIAHLLGGAIWDVSERFLCWLAGIEPTHPVGLAAGFALFVQGCLEFVQKETWATYPLYSFLWDTMLAAVGALAFQGLIPVGRLVVAHLFGG